MKSRTKRAAGRPKGTSTGGARPLTNAEIKRLKATASFGDTKIGKRNHALISFLLGTGARVSEPLMLTISHIAPNGKVLPSVCLDKHQTKSRRSRRLYLSKTARRELQEYLDWRTGNAGRTGPLACLDEPLFPARIKYPTRGAMGANYASILIRNLLAEAGIHNASAHSFRATFATALVKASIGISHIQHLLGHKSLQTTQRYLTSTDADLGEAVGALPF